MPQIDDKRFSVRTYKVVELTQNGVTYVFTQFEGQFVGHCEAIKNGRKLDLGAQFDLMHDLSLYGLVPDKLTINEWREHLSIARRLLSEWGGTAKFRALPFKRHFFRRDNGQEVTLTEAQAG